MTQAFLNSGTCKYTGKAYWYVTYSDNAGRAMRTSSTTSREEACVWGRIIENHGYCMSAKAGPL